MSSSMFKHNKKRNGGLIYEFLIRKLTQCLIENDAKRYNSALSIVKKYYSPGMPLAREKDLFDTIFESDATEMGRHGDVTRIAKGLISEVKDRASNLDFRVIDIKKSNLIKDVHKRFGKSFFSEYKINRYKAFASMQLLINGCNPNRSIEEGAARVVLEESLLNFIVRPSKKDNSVIKEADSFTYSVALKKFDKRYAGKLDESQRDILKEYVTLSMSKDSNATGKFFDKKRKELCGKLTKNLKSREVRKDDKMKQSIVEVRNTLAKMEFDDLDDGISELMLYARLVEEMESND